MKLELIPCSLAHIRVVANNLREEEMAEISLVTGRPKRHLMIALWLRSSYKKALLVDGEVAAVGGDSSPALSLDGEGWLFTTPLVENIAPLTFFRLVRSEVAEVMRARRSLRSSILAESGRCARFYELLGFAVYDPVNGLRDIELRA